MVIIFIQLIVILVEVITWLVIASVLLSYFLSPYHPIRETLDQIVRPMMEPIRKIMPQTGMIDFSPLVLLLLVRLVGNLLIRVLSGFI